jgi:hypothetical protein
MEHAQFDSTGGPAFPVAVENHANENVSLLGEIIPPGGDMQCFGMTLRDYFAAKAMQAAATNPTGADGFSFSQRAEWAYGQADAMLAERRK